MAMLNTVESEICITCKNTELYEGIVKKCKNLTDYSNCLQIDENLLIAMCDAIETNFMDEHAKKFLSDIIKCAKEADPEAVITGAVSWKDDFYNTGEVHIIEDNDSYRISDPVYMDRDEAAIHNASTESLIKELSERGYSVTHVETKKE